MSEELLGSGRRRRRESRKKKKKEGGGRKEGRMEGRWRKERQKRAGVPRVRWLDACLILANMRI